MLKRLWLHSAPMQQEAGYDGADAVLRLRPLRRLRMDALVDDSSLPDRGQDQHEATPR
jgi:hypothetical protein